MSETGKLIVEYAIGSFVFVRDFDEGLHSYDTITKRVMKNLSDPFAITDTSRASVGKAAQSLAPIADTTSKAVEIERGDRLQSSDNLSKTFKAKRSAYDAMAAEESGVAFIQDYVEPGYFLDDYVGNSRGW